MSVTNSPRKIRQRPPLKAEPEQPIELTFDVVPSRYFQCKLACDRVLAALLLIPGLPIIGLLVLVVRLTSRGPGIYRQVRTGEGRRPFTMLKIRTMPCDAEHDTGTVWTLPNDARVTRLGKVLRKLHLDEFPQLFNVLAGEMSLVGPRPERPEFVAVLADAVPGYLNRLAVRPGITGLSQINLPPDSDVESVRRKVALDLAYIEEAGPWLDLRMLLCTFVRVLGVPGTLVMILFGLRRVPGHKGAVEDLEPDAFVTPEKISAAQTTAAQTIAAQTIAAQILSNAHGNGDGNGNGKEFDFDKLKKKSKDVSESPRRPR